MVVQLRYSHPRTETRDSRGIKDLVTDPVSSVSHLETTYLFIKTGHQQSKYVLERTSGI